MLPSGGLYSLPSSVRGRFVFSRRGYLKPCEMSGVLTQQAPSCDIATNTIS